MSHFSAQDISSEDLKGFVQKIEALEDEKKAIADHIREAMQEAKDQGFDPRILRQVVRLRKMKRQERIEQETLLELYLRALGES